MITTRQPALTLEELRAVPFLPYRGGAGTHDPVPHHRAALAVERAVTRADGRAVGMRFWVGRRGADLAADYHVTHLDKTLKTPEGDYELHLGLTNSTSSRLALKLYAGLVERKTGSGFVVRAWRANKQTHNFDYRTWLDSAVVDAMLMFSRSRRHDSATMINALSDLRKYRVSAARVNRVVLYAARKGVVTWSRAGRADSAWWKLDRETRTGFDLLAGLVDKVRFSAPTSQMERKVRLFRVASRLITKRVFWFEAGAAERIENLTD